MRGPLIALASAAIVSVAPTFWSARWMDARARAESNDQQNSRTEREIAIRAKQLQSSSSYKVRLSAALWLTEHKSASAIAALALALQRDPEPTVRRVAAAALARTVDESTPPRARDQAIAALEMAAGKDRDARVRERAAAAFASLRPLRTPRRRLPRVFVAIGQPVGSSPSATSGDNDTLQAMQSTVRRTLRDRAPEYGQAVKADGLPTGGELRAAGAVAFYVNASLADVQVARNGRRADIRCSVSMRVNPWSGADGNERFHERDTAAARGSGRVLGDASPRSIANAKRECAVAVVEELTRRQILPFLRRAADRRLAQSGED